jgi:hypothetical protein
MSITNVAGLGGVKLHLEHTAPTNSDYDGDTYLELRNDGKIGIIVTRSRDGGRLHKIESHISIDAFEHAVQMLRNGGDVM